MLKLIAGILLIIGTSGIGFCVCKEQKIRLLQLLELKRMCLMMQNEIEYSKKPLFEVCKAVAKDMKEPYQGFLMEVYSESAKNSGQRFTAIWQQSLSKLEGNLSKENRLFLDQEDLRPVVNMFGAKGYMNEAIQMKEIGLRIEELQKRVADMESKMENKNKVSMCFGVMSGLLASILFW